MSDELKTCGYLHSLHNDEGETITSISDKKQNPWGIKPSNADGRWCTFEPVYTRAPSDEWQPIETAKARIRYLLKREEHIWIGRGGNIKEGYWFNDSGYACNTPTHWMPLPQPPSKGA